MRFLAFCRRHCPELYRILSFGLFRLLFPSYHIIPVLYACTVYGKYRPYFKLFPFSTKYSNSPTNTDLKKKQCLNKWRFYPSSSAFPILLPSYFGAVVIHWYRISATFPLEFLIVSSNFLISITEFVSSLLKLPLK